MRIIFSPSFTCYLFVTLSMLLVISCNVNEQQGVTDGVKSSVVQCSPNSHIVKLDSFPSKYISPRDIRIYLPYEGAFCIEERRKEAKRSGEPMVNKNTAGLFGPYPVIYAHDGQNLFETGNSFGGNEWGLDEALDSLIWGNGGLRPAIVVGISNTSKRYQEYMPEKPAELIGESIGKSFTASNTLEEGEELLSDEYLKFIVEELKPFVEENYRFASAASPSFLMGSSMGGLISAYGLCEYPEVFSRAACLSTHWPALDGVFLEYVAENLPAVDQGSRFYFDHGTVNLDSTYAPFQLRADSIFQANGYTNALEDSTGSSNTMAGATQAAGSYQTHVVEGADHNEVAWRERLPQVLEFLLAY